MKVTQLIAEALTALVWATETSLSATSYAGNFAFTVDGVLTNIAVAPGDNRRKPPCVRLVAAC